MADSQSDSNVFSVRIVSIDYYMAPPIPDMDICYSSFQGGKVNEVPVIRIYGSTPAGQKTCLHVHKALPYLYVPCSDMSFETTDEANSWTHVMAHAIEKALTLKSCTRSKRQHVHSCTLVRARKFYGYHSSEELFTKIHLYYPHDVARVASLLLGGSILDKSFQPHESHIPYLLQFLVDYNLYGMGLLHASVVKFRHPLPDKFITRANQLVRQHSAEASTCPLDNYQTDSHAGKYLDSPIWTYSTVPTSWLWQFPSDDSLDQGFPFVKRQSASELEGDATVDDIMNQQYKLYSSLSQTASDVKMVQSLIPIWEEEYERTGLHEDIRSSDICKPIPEDVLRTFSQGHEFENTLLDLCRVIRNSSTSLVSIKKKAEDFIQSIKSLTDVRNLVEFEDVNAHNPNEDTSGCSKERSMIAFKPLRGSPLRLDDATPSEEKSIFPEELLNDKEMLRHENTETSDQVVIDKEGLGLLRWLASSQAQEDLDTGDELIHNLILSPLLVKTSINEVLEKANLDYEHESQQECQDILDSVEGLTDSEISGQGSLHSAGYGHSTKIPDNLIPQVDGSGDDQVATYVDNSSQEEVNCDLDKSPQNILQDTCLDLSCTLTSKKRSWGSLTFSTQQMESNDLVSPRFTDTPNDTNNNTETSSLSGNKMNSSSGDSEFKTKIDVGSKEGNTLTGCSMRDLMRRKRCHRIEPSKHGTSKVKKILVRKEQEETTSSPSRVMFNTSVNQVEAKMPSALDKPLIADQEIAALESGCCVTNRYANCDIFPMHGEQSFSCGGSNILEAGSIQTVQLGGRENHDNVLHVGVAPESESIIMTDLAILQPKKEEVRQSHNLVKENTAALAGLHEHHEVKEEFGLSSGCSLRSLVKGVPEAFAYMKQPPKFFSEHQTTDLTLVQPEDAVSLQVKKEETLSVAASWSLGAGNMERGPIEYVEMTFGRRPPLIDCIDRMPENESTAPSLTNQNFFMNAGNSDRTFDCKSNSFDPAGTADDEILPFFVDTSPVEKLQYKPNVPFPFHHEIVLGVPTHYRNDGSSEFLLTPVYAPPSLDCVTRWLLDLAPQHNIAGVLKETIDHTIPALSPKLCSVSLVDQLSQDSLKKKASICQTEVSKLCNEGTSRNEIEQIGSWQDVSQISGPDAQSKLTPLSQLGFCDPASVGGGQQLTSISMEVLTESRGDLRPDPRFDAVNVIALVIQEDNDEVLDVFVLLRGIDGESCQRNGISGCKMIVASDERQLFDHFVKIVLSIDPDILMGWEIQGSSLGYLAERAAHLGMLLLNDISRISSLETKIPCTKAMQGDLLAEVSLANSIVLEDAIIEDEWGRTHASGVHVGGRIVLNIWRLMRGEVKLNMYTIEAVAEEVLRCKIPSIPFRILTQWFSSGPAKARFRCIEYAVGRTKLNLEIMNQLDMINRTSELARVFGIDFFSVLSRGSQYRVESMLLRLAHTQNYLAVSPGNQQVASQPAMECLPLVMEPESGFYADPVVVLDFQSLYPSMIIAYNLCFSTCLGKVIPPKENILGVSSYSPDPQILMDVKHHVLLTPNGVMYVPSKVRRGVLPRMLEEILSTRIMVKKAMKKLLPSQQVLYRIFNARQLALKLIANVTYGYTAAGFSGRMPCAELADSIVQCGRSTLEKAISLVNSHDKWNARVIYGDTDSMFVLLKGRTRKEAFRIGQEIASEITSMNPDPVTLKMEKVYHPCFLLTKKRYVGYSYESPDQAEPLFDAKGIETVRRDSCGAVTKLLEQSLKLYFEHQDISKVKEYLLRQWTRILGGRVSLQDFVFAKEVRLGTYASGATSLPPAAIVATKAMQADPRAEPRYAERVPYVVIHGAPGARLIDMVIDPMDLLRIDSPFRLNDLYYINKQIIPALQRVFGLVGADLNQWFLEMPRPIRSTVSKCHSYAPNAQRTRIDSYYISRHCILCGEFVQASNHLCNKCFQEGPAATTAVVCRTKKLERDIQHLTAICQHCGGVDWIVENGVKCTSLACTLFYERRKVQKELQALSAVATEVGLYPRCVVEWF